MSRTGVPAPLRALAPLLCFAALGAAPARPAPPPAPGAPAPPAPAPPPARREEDLSPLLARIRAAHDLPAMGALLLRHDQVEAFGVDGVRRRGAATKVERGDRWHLGSCTKAMTATLCARLVEAGALRFDLPLPQGPVGFVPEGADRGWAGATLAHLLSNRSGAPAALDRDGLWGTLWRREGVPSLQRRRLLVGTLRRPPEHAPGTAFEYSNAGFSIAGNLAECVERTPYETLMETRVFAPLGITSASFGAPGRPGTPPDAPRGHPEGGAPVEPGPGADNPPAIAPAGTCAMSLADWGRFVAMHLQGARGESTFLSKASFARLHTPAPGFDYAMGWAVTRRPWAGDGPVLTHSGSNTMWFCVAWLAPARDFAVLVVCNQGGDAAAKACDEVAAALVTR